MQTIQWTNELIVIASLIGIALAGLGFLMATVVQSRKVARLTAQLEQLQGLRLADKEREGGAETKAQYVKHYVAQVSSRESHSENRPWSSFSRSHFPPYDSFWADQSFCRHVIGCLYKSSTLL